MPVFHEFIMETLTPRQRKTLKSLAHGLKPVVQIGQKGLTPAVLAAIARALDDHELIKVKFLDFKDEREALAAGIAADTAAHLVGIIGNIAIMYRRREHDPELVV